MLNLADVIQQPYAGIRSVECECELEFIYLVPEEFDKFLSRIIFHLTAVHGIEFPTIKIISH